MNLQKGQIWYYTKTAHIILIVGQGNGGVWAWMSLNMQEANWFDAQSGWGTPDGGALENDLKINQAKLIGHINELDIESFVQEKLTVDISAS
jgi:hypothetical protein